MFKNALFLALSFSSVSAQAAEILSASFDPMSANVTVEVKYGGGCKPHQFKLVNAGCKETTPASCTMNLVEKVIGGPDLCEKISFETLVFTPDQTGLKDSYFDGATITIKSNVNSKSFKVAASEGGSADLDSTPGIICQVGVGKIVKFVPQFGEVQFLTTSGADWAQHHDGLSFDTIELESNPPVIQTTIRDDEGTVVGGWSYRAGTKTFTVKYIGRKYTLCSVK